MTTIGKITFGAVVVVVTLLLGWGVNNIHFGSQGVTFGAVGNLLAENYINYVRQNGGYNSADPITTSGLLTATGGSVISGVSTLASAVFSGLVQTDGGQLYSNASATTTAGATETLVVADVANYDTVILTPNVAGNTTLTLFASSTASTWLPAAGDTQRTCFLNSTTTANVYYIFAGGTGSTVLVASSTATVLGSPRVGPQKMGCFTFVRGGATATTFDILGAFSSFQ